MADYLELYEKTVKFFAEAKDVPEKVVVVKGVVDHYFPDELLCNREFMDCIEKPGNYSFTWIFKQYFALFSSYSDQVRKNSHTLLELIIEYLKPEEDDEYYTEYAEKEIAASLKEIIDRFEYRKKEIGCNYADKMIADVSGLEVAWKNKPSYGHLIDILEYISSQWDYFHSTKEAGSLIHFVTCEYNLAYNKDVFLKTYSEFVKLSKLDYILETSIDSIIKDHKGQEFQIFSM